jgi:hypothetical protein
MKYIDETLAKLTKRNREKPQFNESIDDRGDITKT